MIQTGTLASFVVVCRVGHDDNSTSSDLVEAFRVWHHEPVILHSLRCHSWGCSENRGCIFRLSRLGQGAVVRNKRQDGNPAAGMMILVSHAILVRWVET